MKTWIDLAATALDLSAVAPKINDRIQILTKDRSGLIWMPHACSHIVTGKQV